MSRYAGMSNDMAADCYAEDCGKEELAQEAAWEKVAKMVDDNDYDTEVFESAEFRNMLEETNWNATKENATQEFYKLRQGIEKWLYDREK